jgi:O-methyltransferase
MSVITEWATGLKPRAMRLARGLIENGPIARTLEVLDRRMDNRMTNRGMIAQAFEFKRNNQVSGDYFEFGMYEGNSFVYAHRMKHKHRQHDCMLWGFDSFEGLPDVAYDKQDVWHKGEFAVGEEAIRKTLKRHGFRADEFGLVKGFYDQSLNDDVHRKLAGRKAAIVYVDCDLYESTVPVLEFVHRYLDTGSIVCFDDFYGYRGDPRKGEQRALHEYLERHPDRKFTPYFPFGPIGQSFIVHVP